MELTVAEILRTEFSEDFVKGMKNRMALSLYKYGPVKINVENHLTKVIPSLELRLAKYKETGNTEYLMDVANLAMMEYMYPQHPQGHFKATDSTESPGLIGKFIGPMIDMGGCKDE